MKSIHSRWHQAIQVCCYLLICFLTGCQVTHEAVDLHEDHPAHPAASVVGFEVQTVLKGRFEAPVKSDTMHHHHEGHGNHNEHGSHR